MTDSEKHSKSGAGAGPYDAAKITNRTGRFGRPPWPPGIPGFSTLQAAAGLRKPASSAPWRRARATGSVLALHRDEEHDSRPLFEAFLDGEPGAFESGLQLLHRE